MSKGLTDSKHYTDIAEAIRSNMGDDAKRKPSEMADGVDAACSNAYARRRDHGYSEGEQAEYDRFWDAFQDSGNRTNYSCAFSGIGWTKDSFHPKYDIIASNFYQAFLYNDNKYDLKQHLQDCGVTLDTSSASTLNYAFQYAGMTVLPVISALGANSFHSVFANMPNLTQIEKLVLRSDGSQTFGNVFTDTKKLSHLIIEGTIGKNGFNVSWSPLNKASLISIVNALSATTTGLTVTLSLAAVNKAFETSSGANDGVSSAEWAALIATKSNWTISLV
jgi:hypothetical protein